MSETATVIPKKILADVNAVGEREESLLRLLTDYENQGADGCYLYDFTREEAVRDRFLGTVRKLKEKIDLPLFLGVAAPRFEDVKKALYAGAERVYLKACEKDEVFTEALSRFGSEKVGVELDYSKDQCNAESFERLRGLGVEWLMIKHVECSGNFTKRLCESSFSVMIRDSLRRNDLEELFVMAPVAAVATTLYEGKDIRVAKRALSEKGIPVVTVESSIPFSSFKKNADGLVPAIAQDYRTGEVLMLAYMNEESYNKTIETGKMTYFSRSRNELWCKGDTSGHYQYVKELLIDCDQDTILAKVRQVGAACHTGKRSCFFTELAAEESGDAGAGSVPKQDVLEKVFATIRDRKEHPKEGSYTNYLFEKGIDKILKKCGEESAEIIIAAKNPDQTELKYEIADYLYHLMVLMAERGLGWDEIFAELESRH